jgi:hypothetical protein
MEHNSFEVVVDKPEDVVAEPRNTEDPGPFNYGEYFAIWILIGICWVCCHDIGKINHFAQGFQHPYLVEVAVILHEGVVFGVAWGTFLFPLLFLASRIYYKN